MGWGSLLWDPDPEFDKWHHEWLFDGPVPKIEFSRVSATRARALTLVLDIRNGRECTVAYALSRRRTLDDAIADLRCREGTTIANIGVFSAEGSRLRSGSAESLDGLKSWMSVRKMDHVVWTDLKSNFEQESHGRKPFSVDAGIAHIQSLDAGGKARAAEYVWRAPAFVQTPLRDALQTQLWFARPTERNTPAKDKSCQPLASVPNPVSDSGA
ncbi:MAG: hypothetical protein WEC76_05480 [Steroidobacteraceae bacterium]